MISWNLRKWNISFIRLSLKCVQPCVNSHFFFSTVKLELGDTFSKFISRFKVGLMLYSPILSKFFWIHKETENWNFWISLGCTSKFFPIYFRAGKCGFLKLPFYLFEVSIFCQIVRIVFQVGYIYVMGRGANIHYVTILR